MGTILIAEDETHISELMKRNLALVGHECVQVFDGNQVETVIAQKKFDLILLDVMLPYKSGFELMNCLEGIPVIFVTAKGQLEDKLRGLALGAEDYIVKPFEMLELVARVGVVLRRNKWTEDVFSLGDAVVSLSSRNVKVKGVDMELTPQEFNLLESLILNKNIALSRDRLLELAWGYDYEGETKTVDVHIQKLRKKLGWETYIKTITKVGYRLEC